MGWPELFFDLVFVFAITQVTLLLKVDHSAAGMARALVVFVPIYWTWVGAAIQSNLRDTARPSFRVTLFVVALASIFMAISVPLAYAGLGMTFAVAYWSGRIVVGTLMVGRWPRTAREWFTPYNVSILVSGPLLVAGATASGSAREQVWALAALIDLAAPTVLHLRLREVHYNAEHLAERFGAFVLIALGESVVVIGASVRIDHHMTVASGFAVASAFALAAGLWWAYFHLATDAVRHALATAPTQANITRVVLSYGHLLFIGAIIALSVGLIGAVGEPVHHLTWNDTGLLVGGVALFLTSFGYWRWVMFRQLPRTRLVAAAVVVLMWPVVPRVPAVAALALLALILIGLNVAELVEIKVREEVW